MFVFCSAIIYHGPDNALHIGKNNIEDLLFKKDLDSNVIHFYMKHLENKGGLKRFFSQRSLGNSYFHFSFSFLYKRLQYVKL